MILTRYDQKFSSIAFGFSRTRDQGNPGKWKMNTTTLGNTSYLVYCMEGGCCVIHEAVSFVTLSQQHKFTTYDHLAHIIPPQE